MGQLVMILGGVRSGKSSFAEASPKNWVTTTLFIWQPQKAAMRKCLTGLPVIRRVVPPLGAQSNHAENLPRSSRTSRPRHESFCSIV